MKFSSFLLVIAIVLADGFAFGGTNSLTTASFAAGQTHGLALRSDGTVWSWGTNRAGELGHGSNSLVFSPRRITSLSNAVGLAAAPFHSLAVVGSGAVWAWGTNGNGRLGNGTSNSTNSPVQVTRLTNAVQVAAGGTHSLAVLADGRVMGWGGNDAGQLGTGNKVSTNQPVVSGSFANAMTVAAGLNHSLALTKSGEVWSWGTNSQGQLGLSNTTSQLSPVKIPYLSNIVQIAAGDDHSIARDANGLVYVWGRNAEGQIGDGTLSQSLVPKLVANVNGAKSITAHFNSSACLSSAGLAYYWGAYHNGTSNGVVSVPNLLGGFGQSFDFLSYGEKFLLLGKADGAVWAWGNNQSAQWGNGAIRSATDTWRYEAVNPVYSFSARPVAEVTRFNRGDRETLTYNSFVLPLDMEQGVRLDALGSDLYSYGQSTPWFLRVQKIQRQQALRLISGTTNLTRYAVENPVAAFGRESGASSLYATQPYTFGLYAGAFDEKTSETNMLRISVYDRAAFVSGATNIAPTNVVNIRLPRRFIAADTNLWSSYVANGNRVVVDTNGLRTVVEFSDYITSDNSSYNNWGLAWMFAFGQNVNLGGYRVTHTALSTNYFYIVEGLGAIEVGANVMAPLATTNGTVWAHTPLYSLDFEVFPSERSRFIDQPHFAGNPLPPTYAGRTLAELNRMMAVVTNSILFTNNASYTSLDSTPELRAHPLLDTFVENMGRDPLALASYVINEIGFTDPISLQEKSKLVADSVDLGGVNRSALGTFLEGQGSPTEQCALLVYLLRRAGYSAGYVFPTNSNLRLLDTTLSRLWQIGVKGVVYHAGVPVVTNSLVVVNYPWVVANIGTNCVHIFPWLKDTEIVEGKDIYDYMPTNYPTAYHFLKDYASTKPELMALALPNEGFATAWKRYLTSLVNSNQTESNLSLDDFGVRAFNRRRSFSGWGQLPVPNFLTNQAQVVVVPTLTESAITYPVLTNLFDRVRIEVYKNNTNSAGNRIFDTGLWRGSDFHNRKLLLFTNAPNQAALWLAPYRPSLTNTTNFANFETGAASLNPQLVQVSITASDTNFVIRRTYQRRAATLSVTDAFFPMAESGGDVQTVTMPSRALTCLFPEVSKVSQNMMRMHADDYWQLEQKRTVNPNLVVPLTDDVGTAAMMLGSAFFERLWSDDQLNQSIHKVRELKWSSFGAVSFTKLTSGKMQVALNMNWTSSLLVGNARLRQDSGDRSVLSLGDYYTILNASGSGTEHVVLASIFDDNAPLSALRLLQLAADRWRSNSLAAPLELNVVNYSAAGNSTYTGYGATLLKNQDPAVWSIISNLFTSNPDRAFYRILATPGAVTNTAGSYKGMAAIGIGRASNISILGESQNVLNGGFGSADLFWFGSPSFASYDLTYSLQYSPTFGYTFVYNNFSVPQPRFDFSQYDALTLTATSGVQRVIFTPQQMLQSTQILTSLNLGGSSSTADAIKTAKDVGWMGLPSAAIQQQSSTVADPVQVVFGDFYASAVDLTLEGPFPLQLKRSYLSRNLADTSLGNGWRLSFTPWLVSLTNGSGLRMIYAAEVDGSVLGYRFQTNNLWLLNDTDNPGLVNFTSAGIGSVANQYANRLEQFTTNGVLYVLTTPNGSRRFYQELSFFGLSSGTNVLNRVRPYLTRWEDHAGNFQIFTYGTNSTANDFGQLKRIDCSNGATLALQYDGFGRIIEAFTDDQRRVRYQYDEFGDLTSVQLPDDALWEYEYQHYTFTTNGTTYTDSNHLLVQEKKPDNRVIANTYDGFRRVTTQAATVGRNRELVTNAWFFYTNNCTSLTNDYLTGSTRVEDVFHNPTVYSYTNNLITRIAEPLGRITLQDWFEASETNKTGYYRRSLERSINARGLTNDFRYDGSGNLTSQIRSGNLTGEGNLAQTSTNLFTYTSNLISTATDPSGTRTSVFYTDSADPYRPTRIEWSSGSAGIATNRLYYTNITEVVDMGGWSKTNRAYGRRSRVVASDVATNDWVFNGRGFPIQAIRYAATGDYPGNTDPAVVTTLSYTSQGDVSQMVDAAGRRVQFGYDTARRLLWRDVQDEQGNGLARESFYYNRNGELEWYVGPQTGPDNLVWFDYDGAGRKVQEIQWRSRAKLDGSGVEAEEGDALYATESYKFDSFGNMIQSMDPRGAFTTNTWDSLGRLVTSKKLDRDGTTILTTQGLAYEPGGLVQYQTNALNGLTEFQYTSGGQPRFRRAPDGSTNGWTYYLDGRLRREIANNGAYWETSYSDASRQVTKIFYSSSGTALATNVSQFDRRGNLVRQQDAGGFAFTNVFDGLNRLKFIAGPVIQFTNPPGVPQLPNALPPVQQTSKAFFDASGLLTTNVNAVGDKIIVWKDAIGRTTRSEVRDTNNVLIRVSSIGYSRDYHTMWTTNGSGASAVISTTFMDHEGRAVLSVGYPGSGATEFTRREFDALGNMTFSGDYSSLGAQTTFYSGSALVYDALNRPIQRYERDNALTQFAYDPLGQLTNRTMPGGLEWRGRFNAAGQLLDERNVGSGGAVSRPITNTYYSSGHVFAGLLQTRRDGRGVVLTQTYDDWLRPATNSYSGANPEQNLSTIWRYDARGLVTNILERFANGTTGPSNSITRGFDPYSLLKGETIKLDSASFSSASLSRDSSGRRSGLGMGAFGYLYTWQADGLMTSDTGPTGGGLYTYDNGGKLVGRIVGARSTTITGRDGAGRPLGTYTTIAGNATLTETFSWSNDGLPLANTLTRTDFTDYRTFTYGNATRRLVEERLSLSDVAQWANTYTYDGGQASGPGILTKSSAGNGSTSPTWSGALDAFSRVGIETNNVTRRSAYGRINGVAMTRVLLDGIPQPFSVVATTNAVWTNQWRATLELTPGAHQLQVIATLPGSFYLTNAVAYYTNNSTGSITSDTHDGDGNVTLRVWKNADGSTNRWQSLSWDAKDRLYKVTERDSSNTGRDTQFSYDALGRLLRAKEIVVTNGVSITGQPILLDHYYDPEVEFLELGVTEGGQTTWKLLGPDNDGIYGGQNGTGGFDALIPAAELFCPIVSDLHGNLLALYDQGHGSIVWYPSRTTGYGAVPGYRPVPLGQPNADLGAKYAYRNRAQYQFGGVYLGGNWYDPESARFLSFDPLGHSSSPNGYSAFNGNPYLFWDPDGRLAKQAVNTAFDFGGNATIGLADVLNPVPAQLRPQTPGPDTMIGYYGRRTGEGVGAALSLAEIYFGIQGMALGGTITGAGGVAEVGTAGAATPIAVPAIAVGGILVVGGAVVTTHGGIGLNNFISLRTQQPSSDNQSGQSGSPQGSGPYQDVGGHHVHAQSGFRGHPDYDPNRGFSIGQDLMEHRGWSHQDMTAAQRRLFDELATSGRPNTLREHTRIAVEALKAGGASEAEARQLVAESLRNLRNQGVTQPTRIPWNTPPPNP